jgi:hypothetical protein
VALSATAKAARIETCCMNAISLKFDIGDFLYTCFEIRKNDKKSCCDVRVFTIRESMAKRESDSRITSLH